MFKIKNSGTIRKFAVAAVLASVAVVAVPTAAEARVASCTTSTEVCRDTRANVAQTSVSLRTQTSNVSSGSAQYTVNKGVYGAAICSGTMGYNATRTCNLGGYTGQLTFTFYKGQGSLTTISMS